MMESRKPARKERGKKQERRREPRLEIEVRVKLDLRMEESALPSDRPRDYWTIASQLSAGGCRVLLPLELEREEKIGIELHLPRKKIIKAVGEVRWQRMSLIGGLYETGLEFKSLSANDRLALMEFLYLERRRKQPKGGEL